MICNPFTKQVLNANPNGDNQYVNRDGPSVRKKKKPANIRLGERADEIIAEHGIEGVGSKQAPNPEGRNQYSELGELPNTSPNYSSVSSRAVNMSLALRMGEASARTARDLADLADKHLVAAELHRKCVKLAGSNYTARDYHEGQVKFHRKAAEAARAHTNPALAQMLKEADDKQRRTEYKQQYGGPKPLFRNIGGTALSPQTPEQLSESRQRNLELRKKKYPWAFKK